MAAGMVHVETFSWTGGMALETTDMPFVLAVCSDWRHRPGKPVFYRAMMELLCRSGSILVGMLVTPSSFIKFKIAGQPSSVEDIQQQPRLPLSRA
jgi:hypothetical protein